MPDDDPVDRYLVSCLEQDASQKTRDWAIEVILARKGITPSWKDEKAIQATTGANAANPSPSTEAPTPAIPDFLKND